MLLRWELTFNPWIYIYAFIIKLIMLRGAEVEILFQNFHGRVGLKIKKIWYYLMSHFAHFNPSVNSHVPLILLFIISDLCALHLLAKSHNDFSRMDNPHLDSGFTKQTLSIHTGLEKSFLRDRDDLINPHREINSSQQQECSGRGPVDI